MNAYFKNMKNTLITIFIKLLTIYTLAAQNSSFGLQGGVNLSTQLNYNPEIPQDGTFQWNNRTTWNAGIIANWNLFSEKQSIFLQKISVKGRLLYNNKGFREYAQIGSIGAISTYGDYIFDNKFYYISLDASLHYRFLRGQVSPVFIGGIRVDYLLDYKMESQEFPVYRSYPIADYGNFNKWTTGFIVGLGLYTEKGVTLSLETNLDFSLLVNKSNLQVRNWVTSFNLILDLFELKKANNENKKE